MDLVKLHSQAPPSSLCLPFSLCLHSESKLDGHVFANEFARDDTSARGLLVAELQDNPLRDAFSRIKAPRVAAQVGCSRSCVTRWALETAPVSLDKPRPGEAVALLDFVASRNGRGKRLYLIRFNW